MEQGYKYLRLAAQHASLDRSYINPDAAWGAPPRDGPKRPSHRGASKAAASSLCCARGGFSAA